VVEKLERLSGADTDRAVRDAHVVVRGLDANDMVVKQERTIARHVIDQGRALGIAANKWDAIEDKNEALKRLKERVEKSLPQVTGIPVVTLSARSGRNLDRLMQAVFTIYGEWNKRVPTAQLNRYLEAATVAHPPPLVRGRRIKLRYMTQIKTRPPTFTLFAAKADDLPDAYARYLVNGIRERFELKGTPIRLQLRQTDNPFAEKG
jgi:GTP-binding protein